VKPAGFSYVRPTSLEEALAQLADPDAKPLAGGQSLIPAMNFRLAQPAKLVDLNAVGALAGIAAIPDGGLRIGAMTRHRAVETSPLVAARAPLLAEAMPFIAHLQIRNRGTPKFLIGNPVFLILRFAG
jgi:carbon-monoxide dehydrogenase medium subunit